MKKLLMIILVLGFAATFSSVTFPNKKSGLAVGTMSSIQTGIKSITPGESSISDPKITALLESIKKTIDNKNEMSNQIVNKKEAIVNMISEIKKNGKTLTKGQSADINNKMSSIKTEFNKIGNVKDINLLASYDGTKDNKAYKKFDLEQLVQIQNILTQNVAHLNKISLDHDSILSILTTVSK